MNPAEQLDRGLAALGITASDSQKTALLNYLVLLAKWNQVYNLTALRDERRMVSHHLLDSLAVLPHLHCQRLADVGSGGGLPGIVIAIMRPDLPVVSIEAVEKKCSFQTQAKIALGLSNFSALHARVENVRDEVGFDGIISRAFSSLAQFAECVEHLLATRGYLHAMKGVYPLDEISMLPESFVVERTVQLEVPDVDAARHLVLIKRC